MRARLPRLRGPDGLSARLLLLTGVFTLAVVGLILAPSAASFHERWLLDRIRAAELASVGVEALPYSLVEDDTDELGSGHVPPSTSPRARGRLISLPA